MFLLVVWTELGRLFQASSQTFVVPTSSTSITPLHCENEADIASSCLAMSLDPKHGGRKDPSHHKTNDCVLANHRPAPRLKEGHRAILLMNDSLQIPF
jgi:hypothetical protein